MKKLGSSIALSMVTMLLLSMMTIFPAYAAASIYVDPANSFFSTATTNPGDTFTVTIKITDYANVYAWQVKLDYDNTMLNATSIDVPPTSDASYIFNGKTTAGAVKFYGSNYAQLAESLQGAQPGVSSAGPSVLGSVTFEILRAPGKQGELISALSLDNVDTFLLDPNLDTIAGTVKTDGLYKYTWSPPGTNPHLEVDPSSVLYDEFTLANGSQFDVDVNIVNLDVGWAITNASFVLKFNTTIIDTEVANITINTADWDGAYSVNVVHAIPDRVEITVRTNQSLSGTVLIATITFQVQNIQKTSPPPSDPQISPLDIQDVVLYDHIGTIDLDPQYPEGAQDGEVEIRALQTLAMPWLEVVPGNTTLGPDLVIGEQFGKEFCVDIDIMELHKMWDLIGVQFRLSYDPTLLKVVSITEGPYMASFPNRLSDPQTWFYGAVEPADIVYPEHVIVGNLILPNDNGTWTNTAGAIPETDPEGSGTIATICFRPLVQSWTITYEDTLGIFDFLPTGTNTNAEEVHFTEPVNGSVTILPIEPRGRHIDVWEPTLGGRGLGEPADLALPQMGLNLTAKVTYNWQPVSYKKVTFEIRGPGGEDGQLWAVLQADTDDQGHATVLFRMPWTGQGAEDNLGKWWVGVSVTLADVVITDYMDFDYDYLIHIWSVETDKAEYYKSNDVEITVNYGTKSKRMHNVTMYVTIQDELGVPIGIASLATTVGGGEFCNYVNFTDTVSIHVISWAYAGMATVRVSFVSGLPSEGGEAVAQEVIAIICILPIHVDDPWFTDP